MTEIRSVQPMVGPEDRWKAAVRTMTRPGFRRNRDTLVRYTQSSIDNRSNPTALLELQVQLAREILKLQTTARALRQSSDVNPSTSDELGVAKALIFAVRQIADGIAWRTLRYDRALLRELASANQTGYLELAPLSAEFDQAARHVEAFSSPVIVNDLTNYLRHGDVTVVTNSKIYIDEVKSGSATSKNRRAARQKKRRRELIEFVNQRSRVTAEGSQKLLVAPSHPVSLAPDLKRVMDDAYAGASGHGRLSDAVAIDVFHVESAAQRGPIETQGLHNPFRQTRESGVYRNTDLFGRFSPNVAPISIFPLPSGHRVDLMTGEVLLIAWVNYGNLLRAIRRRGLKARFAEPSDTQWRAILPDEADTPVDTILLVGNETHTVVVNPVVLLRLGYELLNEESVVDLIEYEILQAGDEEHRAFVSFALERELWD